jgi:hypothetical protein
VVASAADRTADTEGQNVTQQDIIVNKLMAVRRNGVNLVNVDQALTALIDAVVYLVQNTPGQLPNAKGIPLSREVGK